MGVFVRPIAIGDTLRRLVGKVLLRLPQVRQQIEGLQRRQTGIGVPFATKIIAMGVRQIADISTQDWAVLQIDVRNAFNSLDRTTMLQGAVTKALGTYNWLAWCYSTPSPLFFQGHELASSTTGVHQGDAMGPLGFAPGLDVALDCCSTEETKIPRCAWYLDDGTLVGPQSALLEYLEKLVPALAAIGLEVNRTKCALWGPGAQTEQDMVDRIPIDHPIKKIPVTPFGPSAGITVLGVPVDAPRANARRPKNGPRR